MQMQIHVARTGVTINFGFPAGRGGVGHVKIVTITSLKIS